MYSKAICVRQSTKYATCTQYKTERRAYPSAAADHAHVAVVPIRIAELGLWWGGRECVVSAEFSISATLQRQSLAPSAQIHRHTMIRIGWGCCVGVFARGKGSCARTHLCYELAVVYSLGEGLQALRVAHCRRSVVAVISCVRTRGHGEEACTIVNNPPLLSRHSPQPKD